MAWLIVINSSKLLGAATAFLALLSVIWFFVGNEVQTYARELVGYGAVENAISKQSVVIEEIDRKVESIEERVTSFHPFKVSEFDQLRSKIITAECAKGEVCHYTYRVRRTPEGVSCGTPISSRVIVDSAGLTYFPRKGDDSQPTRLSSDWAVITSSFIIPNDINVGIAEFYLKLKYPNCKKNSDQLIEELSYPLVFEITE